LPVLASFGYSYRA